MRQQALRREITTRPALRIQHDVDSVIEVPERGTAEQIVRFNKGVYIQIFEC